MAPLGVAVLDGVVARVVEPHRGLGEGADGVSRDEQAELAELAELAAIDADGAVCMGSGGASRPVYENLR